MTLSGFTTTSGRDLALGGAYPAISIHLQPASTTKAKIRAPERQGERARFARMTRTTGPSSRHDRCLCLR